MSAELHRRLEPQRREAGRREAGEAERREAERQEAERQAHLQREAERQAGERQAHLQREAKRQEGERQALLRHQAEFFRPDSYTDLSFSPSGFRLLRLRSVSLKEFDRWILPPIEVRPYNGMGRGYYEARKNQYGDLRSFWDDQVVFAQQCKDAMSGSKQTFDLNSPDCPPFEALSYEWNANVSVRNENMYQRNQGKKHIVLTQGDQVLGSIEIGYNLWSFLDHIRRGNDGIWVWADAVCIDQSNFQERSHQVKLMGDIYTHAPKVLAWLPVIQPDLCFHTLQDLHSITRSTWSKEQIKYFHRAHDLAAFFRSPYWTRKWIIQEILLARTVTLVIGTFELSMQDLDDICAYVEEARKDPPSASSVRAIPSSPVEKLTAYRRNRRQGKTYPQRLCELLAIFGENRCSDPMDHVYALYNLVGEHREHLQVDYNQDHRAWLRGIIQFLDQHEPSWRPDMIRNARTLECFLAPEQFLDFIPLLPGEPGTRVTITAFDRGALEIREDCAYSIYLCQHFVNEIHPGTGLTFEESGRYWQLYRRAASNTMMVYSTRVLSYFEIPGQSLCGMAAARLEEGDRVWQFLNTEFGFIVRFEQPSARNSERGLRILGRCYLFELPKGDERRYAPHYSPGYAYEYGKPTAATLSSGQIPNRKGLKSYDLRVDISDLYALAYTATDAGFPSKRTPDSA